MFLFSYYLLLLLFFIKVFHNKLTLEHRLLDIEWQESLKLRSLMEKTISVYDTLRCVSYWFKKDCPKQ